MAASTVTQAFSLESTVAAGSIHARWALALSGRVKLNARVIRPERRNSGVFIMFSLRGNDELNGAKLAIARLGKTYGAGVRPRERHCYHFSPAHFSCCLHTQLVLPGTQLRKGAGLS